MPVDPVSAMLLAQQRQYDPANDSRRQLAAILQQNAQSFAQNPVKSPMEGIARALTTGVQGLTSGILEGRDEARRKDTSEGLLTLSDPNATPEQIAGANDKLKNADPGIIAAIASQRIATNTANAQAGRAGVAIGGGGVPVAPGTPSGLGTPITAESTAPPASNAPSAPSPDDKAAFVQQITPHAIAVAQATGVDPRLVVAQSALETGYGAHAPGNNYFGVKGPGQVQNTTEAGPNGALVPTQDSFRAYPDMASSVQDYGKLLQNNPRYADVLKAPDLAGQVDAMGKSGYATNPNYGAKLGAIAQTLAPIKIPDSGVQTAQAPVITPAAPPGAAGAPGQLAGSPGTPPATPPAGTLPGGTRIDRPTPAPAGAPVAGANVAAPPAAVPPVAKAPASTTPSAPPQYVLPADRRQYWGDLVSKRIVDPKDAIAMMEKETAAGQAIATEAWKNDIAQKNQAEQNKVKQEQAAQSEFTSGRIKNYDANVRPAAVNAVNDMNLIYRGRQLLEGGAMAGPGTETKLQIGKMLGLAPEQMANTQLLQSTLAQRVLNNLGGHLGAGFSEGDRKFVVEMQGTTNWNKEGLQRLLTIAEQENKNRISQHNDEVGRITQLPGLNHPGIQAQFALPDVPSYEAWKKDNPLTPEQPGAAPTPAAPGAPAPATRPPLSSFGR